MLGELAETQVENLKEIDLEVGRTLGVVSQSLHQVLDNHFGVHLGFNLNRNQFKKLLDGGQMVLIREYLDQTIDQVLLRNSILGGLDQLEDAREHLIDVDLKVHTVQLRETRKIFADCDPQVDAFLLTAGFFLAALHAHPKVVHFG